MEPVEQTTEQQPVVEKKVSRKRKAESKTADDNSKAESKAESKTESKPTSTKRKRVTEEISSARKREINHIVRRAKKNPLITPAFVTAALRSSRLACERVDKIPEYRQTLEKQNQATLDKLTEPEKKQRCQAQYDRKVARLQRIEEAFNKSGRVCLKGLDEAFLSKIKVSKPLSGYMLFAKETRESIQKANPQSNFGEIGRLIGEAWKALGTEGHDTWKNKASQLNAK